MSTPNSLADLSSFETNTDLASEVSAMCWSPTSLLLTGIDGAKEFAIEFDYGYDRPNGYLPDEEEHEPGTLYVYTLDALPEEIGIGSAAIALLLDQAKENDFQLGRMSINNPRAIGVVEKLKRLGLIQSSYYRMVRGSHVTPHPPTATIMHEPDLVSAQTASLHLAAIKEEIAAQRLIDEYLEDHIFVDCAVFF